jgi:hypothetical protein
MAVPIYEILLKALFGIRIRLCDQNPSGAFSAFLCKTCSVESMNAIKRARKIWSLEEIYRLIIYHRQANRPFPLPHQ